MPGLPWMDQHAACSLFRWADDPWQTRKTWSWPVDVA
jgi:hypothetical protein